MATVEINLEKLATDPEYRKAQRRRCQTDLLYLGRVLGYNKLIDELHQRVAEFYIQKKPGTLIENWPGLKQRLHLDPRGTYKTTLAIIDDVQLIIATDGEVRICKLTATKPLATAVVGEIADHFIKSATGEPTMFQRLFPEFCISPRDNRVNEYTAPCRKNKWKEATVMGFSIETSISGWHFDVLDVDDVVDTQNSGTPQGIAKVKTNYRVNKKTLMPWGFINFKGTRYNPFDLWGDLIDKATPGKIDVLVRGALKLKSGARLDPGEFPTKDDVELLFPQLLSYEFLKTEFEDDYETFMSQYMNDAYGGNEVTFSREAMLQATRPNEELPIGGEISIAWRLRYANKPTMKYAGAAVGVLDNNGRMWILDVIRGTFKPSVLAHQVVSLAKKHGVHTVTIEETPGARLLEPAIHNYSLSLGWRVSIQWIEFQEDDAVRELRIKSLEPLVMTGRLLFSSSIKTLKETFSQFVNFGMMDESEIPDAISRVCEKLPKSIAVEELDQEQSDAWDRAKAQDLYDRTHGVGNYAPVEPLNEEKPYTPPSNDYGLEDILGGLNG